MAIGKLNGKTFLKTAFEFLEVNPWFDYGSSRIS
jgi:hypothetical protein